MPFVPCEDPDPGSSVESVGFHVPASLGENVVASSGEPDRVGRLGSGDEPGRGAGRQSQEFLEPVARCLFGRGRRR